MTDDELRETFGREGFAYIRGAVEADVMERLVAQVAQELETPSVTAESGEVRVRGVQMGGDVQPSGNRRWKETPPGARG